MGRNSTKTLSKWNHTTRIIALVNFYLPICYIHEEKGDTHLREIQHGKSDRNPVWDIMYQTNMTTKTYFYHYIVINYPPQSLIISV